MKNSPKISLNNPVLTLIGHETLFARNKTFTLYRLEIRASEAASSFITSLWHRSKCRLSDSVREATRFLRSAMVLEFIGDETGDISRAIGAGGESIFLPLFKPDPDTEERKGRGSMEGGVLTCLPLWLGVERGVRRGERFFPFVWGFALVKPDFFLIFGRGGKSKDVTKGFWRIGRSLSSNERIREGGDL